MSEFPLWSELIRRALPSQDVPKTGEKLSVKESREVVSSLKKGSYNVVPIENNKVLANSMGLDLNAKEAQIFANKMRAKYPRATISIEASGGDLRRGGILVSQVLKPGERFVESLSTRQKIQEVGVISSLKKGMYAVVAIENNKVIPNSMAWDFNETEIVLYANMLRTKHPQATISIEAKGGRISQVLKPGELFKEAAEPQPEFSSGNQKASGWPPGLKLAAIKSYREKEKNNDHTGNALFVTRMFGKPQEIAIVQKLWDIRAKEGIDASKHQSLMSAVEILHSKYYRQLMSLKEENENSDSDYQEYFKKMLQKHGYDSPADIPDDKKDDFFNAVDAGYSAKNEEVDPNATDERDSDDQEMMSAQVDSLVDKSAELHDILNQLKLADVPAWIQSKVSTADTDINAILDYMKYEEKHPVAEDVSDNQGMDRARSMARSAAAAPFQQRLPTMKEPVVPMRMQAAMVVAKALGSVRGTGQSTDFKVSSSSPEALVNQALRVWLSGSHTNEGWALGAKMLKLAKEMGIKWDEKLLRGKLAPITLKKLGLDEAEEAAVGMSNTEKLAQRQQAEKETLALRHNKEKTSQAQRDGEEKIRKQSSANAQTRTSK